MSEAPVGAPPAHRPPYVKICGLRRPEEALVAARAGADFIGLIFHPPSHRYVDLEAARAIRAALDTLPVPPVLVGVFVNTPAEVIAAAVAACGLDLIQLSGDEPAGFGAALPRPVIPVARLQGPADVERWTAVRRRPGGTAVGWLPEDLILLDTPAAGAYGGTGRTGDWTLAREVAAMRPVILSGGLTPENVAAAIAYVQPWGVDVSSGVETERQKDPARIIAFLQAVQLAAGAAPLPRGDFRRGAVGAGSA